MAGDPLQSGECSISSAGALTMVAADLLTAEISGDHCIVLADAESRRIAVRAPRDGEDDLAVRLLTVWKKRRGERVDSGRRSVTVPRALARLGLKARDVRGRRPLIVKDGLLIVHFIDASASDAKPNRGKESSSRHGGLR